MYANPCPSLGVPNYMSWLRWKCWFTRADIMSTSFRKSPGHTFQAQMAPRHMAAVIRLQKIYMAKVCTVGCSEEVRGYCSLISHSTASLPCLPPALSSMGETTYKYWIFLPSLKQTRDCNYVPGSRGLRWREEGQVDESQLDMQNSWAWLIGHLH